MDILIFMAIMIACMMINLKAIAAKHARLKNYYRHYRKSAKHKVPDQ